MSLSLRKRSDSHEENFVVVLLATSTAGLLWGQVVTDPDLSDAERYLDLATYTCAEHVELVELWTVARTCDSYGLTVTTVH